MSAPAFVCALGDVDVAMKAQRLAETAMTDSSELNKHTLAEVATHRRLRDADVTRAPHLRDWVCCNDTDTRDAQAMPGGFVA
jgi:hypothetical protein